MSQTTESSDWILMEDNRQKRDDHQQANLKRTMVHHGVWFNTVYQTYHNYEVWAPHDFSFDSKDKKYPVLLEVYAGPEFQKVQATFKRSWPQVHLPAAYDCLTVSMDGRGSAFQGDKFTFANYRALRFEKYLLLRYN